PPLVVEQIKNVRELGGDTAVYIYLGVVGTGAALLLGATLWTLATLVRTSLKKERRRKERNRLPSDMTAAERQAEIDENLQLVDRYRSDQNVSPEVQAELEQLKQYVNSKREAQTLEIVAFGTISSGKSSLLNALAGSDVFATDPRGGTTVRRNEIPWPGMDKVL